jgi:DNA adenine methylase
MHYLGGKARLNKQISAFLNGIRESDVYWEPFCGACWVSIKIDAPIRVLSDAHPQLIAMWQHLQTGWEPPDTVSEGMYNLAKHTDHFPDYMQGFIGFGCSWGGKWWGGYARDPKSDRNYAKNARNSLLRKTPLLTDVDFTCVDYSKITPSVISQIYCDPPYANTTGYGNNKFDSDIFWKIIREWSSLGHQVVVSEYVAPDDFICVKEFPTKTDLGNKENAKIPRIERLFMHRTAVPFTPSGNQV